MRKEVRRRNKERRIKRLHKLQLELAREKRRQARLEAENK